MTTEAAADPTGGDDRVRRAFETAGTLLDHIAGIAQWAAARRDERGDYPEGTFGHALGHNETRKQEGWPCPPPGDWADRASDVADALIVAARLGTLLTDEVRARACGVYSPGEPAIWLAGRATLSGSAARHRLGETRVLDRDRAPRLYPGPFGSTIEAVADGLGSHLLAVLYPDRESPVELERSTDPNTAPARAALEADWQGVKRDRMAALIRDLAFPGIDIAEVRVRLSREGARVLRHGTGGEAGSQVRQPGSQPTPDTPEPERRAKRAEPAVASAGDHPTAKELHEAAGMTLATFRSISKDAAIFEKLPAWKSKRRRYTPDEVDRLIDAARGRRAFADQLLEQWKRWASKKSR